MPLKRVNIRTVAMGQGPLPSFLVLEQHEDGKARRIPIRIGSVEAAAINSGVHPAKKQRPRTHDLLKATIETLGAQLLNVRICGVEGTTFFAQLVLRTANGREVRVDARPSDAIALAVRCDVDVLMADEVIEAASMLDLEDVREAEQAAEAADFHDFVEHLSPDDFAE
ncbi:bifunctional nuclease family protein [Paratractidigestivibacter sp.]|uniref:bifunctional nuclease family protein n=1 Tax=Paratractidigestivibacter sp. TaxID=2847316 RepID=UPI002ABE8F84|nr:bifunctional nuclease family protein [Paratractidigestivibacter sp.]